MSYSSNPYLPKARRMAVNLVLREKLSVTEAARRSGVHRATLHRWIAKVRDLGLHGHAHIPTLSSAPLNPANALGSSIVQAIVDERERSGRGAYFVHLELREQGINVSLSSVKRTLRREGLTRQRSKWVRHRVHIPRPIPIAPGMLVQIDTIHFLRDDGSIFYVYTLIDLCSRVAYARYSTKCNQKASFRFMLSGQDYLGIRFRTVQTDNGSEFGKWFNDMLLARGIKLRHSRVRRSNDNAHIERFNRTIQEEYLSNRPRESKVKYHLDGYLTYYNQFRRHSGINGDCPLDLLQRWWA